MNAHRPIVSTMPPIALAVTKGCVSIDAAADTVTSTPALSIDLGFFEFRNGKTINELVTDTRDRARSLPRRKANIQKMNLDRTVDPYLFGTENGLIQQYGSATADGTITDVPRLRREVFRRPVDLGIAAYAIPGVGGDPIYVDREFYNYYNTRIIALYRYFLEPLGVSVDKWSMSVRGRSRTYTFADVFDTYVSTFETELESSLTVK